MVKGLHPGAWSAVLQFARPSQRVCSMYSILVAGLQQGWSKGLLGDVLVEPGIVPMEPSSWAP